MARKRLPEKHSTSMRLTDDARELLRGLCDKLGMTPSNVVEQAIRQMARREKITITKEGVAKTEAAVPPREGAGR